MYLYFILKNKIIIKIAPLGLDFLTALCSDLSQHLEQYLVYRDDQQIYQLDECLLTPALIPWRGGRTQEPRRAKHQAKRFAHFISFNYHKYFFLRVLLFLSYKWGKRGIKRKTTSAIKITELLSCRVRIKALKSVHCKFWPLSSFPHCLPSPKTIITRKNISTSCKNIETD